MADFHWIRSNVAIDFYETFLEDNFRKTDFNNIDLDTCLIYKALIENLGFFGIIAFRMKFMIGEEYRNEDINKRAIALAFLLCQIDYRKKEEYITIGMIDSIDLNIYFYSFPIFETIKNEFTIFIEVFNC